MRVILKQISRVHKMDGARDTIIHVNRTNLQSRRTHTIAHKYNLAFAQNNIFDFIIYKHERNIFNTNTSFNFRGDSVAHRPLPRLVATMVAINVILINKSVLRVLQQRLRVYIFPKYFPGPLCRYNTLRSVSNVINRKFPWAQCLAVTSQLIGILRRLSLPPRDATALFCIL